MPSRINRWPASVVDIDAAASLGPVNLARHALGHGGVNPLPLPERVVEGVRRIAPPLVRIFLQEFFRPCGPDGRLDWSRLDAYMDSFAATGAKVVAAICLKPGALFGAVDQATWRPDDVAGWQRLVRELVKRYSVERPLVTHWEIGNEVDIGENGGCPYLIPDPDDYHRYYEMTLAPILEVFPEARVGGPAAAGIDAPVMEGFIRLCARHGTRLDFVSHHLYSDSPEAHAEGVRKAKAFLDANDLGERVETMVTEFSPMFEQASTEDQAFEPWRAGCVAAGILAMLEAGLDWSFHYHIWDQVCRATDFEPFFAGAYEIMVRHWNEIPHRFGLFGVGQEVRPPYFVYRMLRMMSRAGGGAALRLATGGGDPSLRVLATTPGASGRIDLAADGLDVMLINYGEGDLTDRVVKLHLRGLPKGAGALTLYRIDAQRRWCETSLEMRPVEQRAIWTGESFECHAALPAGSVALLNLTWEETA